MARQRQTPGGQLAEQLLGALRDLENTPADGARELPTLRGLTPRGEFVHAREDVLARAIDLMAGSGRLYLYGDGILMEAQGLDGGGLRLIPLRSGDRIEPGAGARLANLFRCIGENSEFAMPEPLLKMLLYADHLAARLPRIRHYARRPIFADDFSYCSPGWHEGPGVLVHGPDIEPILHQPGPPHIPVLERLPDHMRTLLGDFCFADEMDRVHAVAMLVTGVLLNHFVETPKPIFVLDGNRVGIGKTLLAQTVGAVLDGVCPRLLHYTRDEEELQKRLCAQLREGRQSILAIDNAKVQGGSAISSPALETNSMAPEISLRILGHSRNHNRRNDILWLVSMNDTRLSPDLVSRSVPVRLHYEGDPGARRFGSNPVAYARTHRTEILGELMGMVVRWTQRGQPGEERDHRCTDWARILGGILATAGLPEFLSGLSAIGGLMSEETEELAALAEAAVSDRNVDSYTVLAGHDHSAAGDTPVGYPARGWVRLFVTAGLRGEELRNARAHRGRETRVGQLLSAWAGREVSIRIGDEEGRAVLRSVVGRARQRLYYFEIFPADPEAQSPDDAPGPDTVVFPPPAPPSANAEGQ